MALILNIDTATEIAHIGISEDENVLASEINENQMTHAAFVQPAIERILSKLSIPLRSVDALAVSAGPGSYTGLRVGMASAKGICYALNKPLILINTLEILAKASIRTVADVDNRLLFCPMIDARRMEVYAAVYKDDLKVIIPPTAFILNENTFNTLLKDNKMVFSGSGSAKFFQILNHTHATFVDVKHSISDIAELSSHCFQEKAFADLAYSEPFYLKEFFTPGS